MQDARTSGALPRAWRTALFVGAAALFLVGLGRTDLWAPDEPRYAHVTDQLLAFEHGAVDLVVLRVNGEPYTQKPPLYFWLAAAASLPAGAVSEWTARLPSALAGLACVALIFAIGRRAFDARVGAWGAALLASVFDFAFLARRARLDVLLTCCAVLAMYALWRILAEGDRRRRTLAILHAALGLGVLTKGPVGYLPLLAAAVFLVWERRPREWLRLLPAWSLLLSVGLPLAWIASAVLLTPEGFFHEAVVENLAGRYFGSFSKVEPFYYFFYQFPVNFLPWSLLWPLLGLELWRRGRRPPEEREQPRAWRFLLAWVATWFVFFSLSQGKRDIYLHPCFPAAALLCGAALEAWLARRPQLGAAPRRALGLLLGAVATAGVAVLALGGRALPRAPEVTLPGVFGLGLLAAALGAALAWGWLARSGARLAAPLAVGVALVAAVELAVFVLLLPAFDPVKSPRPIAEAALAHAPEGGPIGLYGHTAMIGGLAFYSRRPVAFLVEPDDVRRFVSAGGRVIASRGHNARELAAIAPLEPAAWLRGGRRRYVVMVAKGVSDAADTDP